MGFMDILSGGLLGAFLGGDEPKPVQTPNSVKPAAETKTPSQVAEENDAKRKAALLASNAGGAAKATTVGGGNADVTRKALLGL